MPKKKTWPQLRFGGGSWMHNLKMPQTERREREKNEIETGMWSSVGLCNIGGVSECSLDLCAGVWNPQTTLTWCLTRDTGRPTSSSCWDATLFFSTQMTTGGSSWSLFICDWFFFCDVFVTDGSLVCILKWVEGVLVYICNTCSM